MKKKVKKKVTKPMPKISVVEIENPLYLNTLFITVSDNINDAINWFNEKFDASFERFSSTEPSIARFMALKDDKSHLIWFKPDALKENYLGVIAHEALHSALHVLRVSGIDSINEDNEEALAYLLQWTVGGINEALKNINR